MPSASPLNFAMQALQKLDCSHNHITGSLEPLRGCTALTQLWATHNQLVGGLEPLEGCKALQGLCNWPPFEPVGIITVPVCRSTDPVVFAPCSVRSLPQSTAGRSRAAPGKYVRRRGTPTYVEGYHALHDLLIYLLAAPGLQGAGKARVVQQ